MWLDTHLDGEVVVLGLEVERSSVERLEHRVRVERQLPLPVRQRRHIPASTSTETRESRGRAHGETLSAWVSHEVRFCCQRERELERAHSVSVTVSVNLSRKFA